MFVLDTDVISQLRRPAKVHPKVAAWAGSTPLELHFICSITLYELELGALLIARKDAAQGAVLRAWIDGQILPRFSGRTLPLDNAVAQRCARLHAPDPRPMRDSIIAAAALVHGMTVVTRNVADFEPMGVAVLNPWEWDAESEGGSVT